MPRKHNFSKAQEEDIIKRYKDGESRASISKDFGVTPKVINRILKKNDLKLINAVKKITIMMTFLIQ